MKKNHNLAAALTLAAVSISSASISGSLHVRAFSDGSVTQSHIEGSAVDGRSASTAEKLRYMNEAKAKALAKYREALSREVRTNFSGHTSADVDVKTTSGSAIATVDTECSKDSATVKVDTECSENSAVTDKRMDAAVPVTDERMGAAVPVTAGRFDGPIVGDVPVEKTNGVPAAEEASNADDSVMKETFERIERVKKLQAKKRKEAEKAQRARDKADARERALCDAADYNVPDGVGVCNSRQRTYMGYTAVTSRTSAQYKLLNGPSAWTDEATGFRMVDDRYCIAVGSGYSKKIGTKIDLVMSDGSIIKCITGDAKKDDDTDSTHRYQRWDGSVAEFIVDWRYFNRRTEKNAVNTALGNFSRIAKVVVIE